MTPQVTCGTCHREQEHSLPQGISRDDTVHGEIYYTAAQVRAAIDAAMAARGAVPAWELERMRHIANEWADMAANGLQFMRNIVDGISDESDALENLEKNLIHCRSTNDAPGAYGASEAPQQVAQPSEAAKVRIHTAVASCRECPAARYESSGYYSCEKVRRRFDDEGRPTYIPTWCPLPSHPGCKVAQARPEQLPSIDEIAQFIRTADGAHQMGAGALAERLHEWLTEKGGQR